jgi:hypothetical protein
LLARAPALYTQSLCDNTKQFRLLGKYDKSWSQGARPMQQLDVWHVVWVLVLVVGVVALGLALAIALYFHESSTFVNVASIWGLFVGLIGFIMTLYTLFEAQRVSRKAQREVQATAAEAQQAIQRAANETQEAVKKAQEQVRQVLERVRHGVRDADFATLHMWVKELRTAAGRGDWPRARFFAEQCPAVAERLRNAEGLEDDERKGLREGADNLRLVEAHIRNYRNGTQTTGLGANHAKSVEALATLLERLGGRLHHEPTKGTTS